MEQSSQSRHNIDPYYKNNNVFERDEAYYTQFLTGTRRISNNLNGSARESSLQRSRTNLGQQSRVSPVGGRIVESNYRVGQSYAGANSLNYVQQNTVEYMAALKRNQELKQQFDLMANGSNDYGISENVIKLKHYNLSQDQSSRIVEQQSVIKELEETLRTNGVKIAAYKKSTEQLNLRMNNIQSIDKEIYKTLKGSVNRDQELLDKASSALARGEPRENIAKILQQIIAST